MIEAFFRRHLTGATLSDMSDLVTTSCTATSPNCGSTTRRSTRSRPRCARRSPRRSTRVDPTRRAAVVIACAGRTFVAGADIASSRTRPGATASAPDLHPLLARVEEFRKPIVTAIHGTALGGGLELAMACHYRVAVESAQLGQPEVNLGIIPGAEGTQRLPRLVGVEKALDMWLIGRADRAPPTRWRPASSIEIVDGTISSPSAIGVRARDARARRAAPANARARRPPRRRRKQNAPLFAAARETAREDEAAPSRAAALPSTRSKPPPRCRSTPGCRRERELSAECVRVEQCKALIHVFFAERAASKMPGRHGETTPVDIPEPVAIVGAGTMGGGHRHGLRQRRPRPYILTDATRRGLEAGMAADPPQLRRVGEARPAHAGRRRRAARAHPPAARRTPASTRPT